MECWYVPDPAGLPVGVPVGSRDAPGIPSRRALIGRHVTVAPLDAGAHGDDLWSSIGAPAAHARWTYLPAGPFDTRAGFDEWLAGVARASDLVGFALLVDGRAAGIASYLRIDPDGFSIEVGWINLSPAIARSRAATEAMHLMMSAAFALGYRRYEWKCDVLNAASRRAAERLGLSFEGVFRQARVVKGRNRDTAWFAVLDSQWPALDAVFRQWLHDANFVDGAQRVPLSRLTAPLVTSRFPTLSVALQPCDPP